MHLLRKENGRMIPHMWTIKKSHKKLSQKINCFLYPISLLVGLVFLIFFSVELYTFFLIIIAAYTILSYVLFGAFKCYRVKVFRGHRALRWIWLGFMILFELCVLVTALAEKERGFFYVLAGAVPILLCAIQCVRNGYREGDCER